jgi:hypothetical protein
LPGLPGVDWSDAQAALREEVARVVALLRSVRNPSAHAVGKWSLAEVAMHLSQAFVVVPGLARADLSNAFEILPTLAGLHGNSLIGDVWELGDVTALGVESDRERDPRVLADRIEERAAAFLQNAAAESHAVREQRAWLVEGMNVSLPTFTCHLLNETIMHGRDIAVADGQPWPIKSAHAGLVFDGFIWPIVDGLGPRAMVDQKTAAGVHVIYDIRVRGGSRYRMTFNDGELTIEPPRSGRVDCHISADAAAFLLVAWARQSQWEAIAKGKILAWGRKPWLGPKFRVYLRNP